MKSEKDISEPLVAPYLSFKTFQSAIQNLRTHGLPPKLDKSAWGSRSGAEQSAIWGATKFLGLIDESGVVQTDLQALVNTQEGSSVEKAILADLLKKRYSKVFALDLKTATPMQFANCIGEYNVTSSTRDRAARFFIKAATHVGIGFSERLKKGFNSAPVKRNGKIKSETDEVEQDGGDSEEQEIGRQLKTIDLPKVGGSLTISGTFNAFELEGKERDLVYKIVDLMKTFETESMFT